MILKKDSLKLGMVLGLIGAIIGFIILKFIKAPSSSFPDFIDMCMHDNKFLTFVGTMSLLLNVVLFTLYVNTHRDNTAKGIFIVTLIFGILILLLKVFN